MGEILLECILWDVSFRRDFAGKFFLLSRNAREVLAITSPLWKELNVFGIVQT